MNIFFSFNLFLNIEKQETVIETTLLISAVFQFLLKGVQRFTTGEFLGIIYNHKIKSLYITLFKLN